MGTIPKPVTLTGFLGRNGRGFEQGDVQPIIEISAFCERRQITLFAVCPESVRFLFGPCSLSVRRLSGAARTCCCRSAKEVYSKTPSLSLAA